MFSIYLTPHIKIYLYPENIIIPVISMGFLNIGSSQEVFDKVHELTLAASDTMDKLLLIVKQFHSGKFQNMEKLMLDASSAETTADGKKKDIRRVITEGTFLPHFRQDILELTNRIEHIADAAESTSKIFYITEKLMKANHAKIPKPVKDDILKLTEYGVDLAKKTSECISYLPKEPAAVKPLAKEIGDLQDEANEIELRALRAILDSNLDGFLKVELIDTVRMCGNLADRCNAAVHILTYMLFTSSS